MGLGMGLGAGLDIMVNLGLGAAFLRGLGVCLGLFSFIIVPHKVF